VPDIAIHLRRAIAGILLGGIITACSQAGPSAPPTSTTTVDLPASYRFSPTEIVVGTGATVTWTNDDHFTHSIQFLDGGLPSKPLVMEPGQSATFTFVGAGLYHYQCHLHPQNMRGSVTVSP
jgi:plastocyanin